MKVEINAEDLTALVHEAVAAKYCGDVYTLKTVELVINTPRGKPRNVTAMFDMELNAPRKSPALSAVASE